MNQDKQLERGLSPLQTVMAHCKMCGQSFERHIKSGQMYCSKMCRGSAKREQKADRKRATAIMTERM